MATHDYVLDNASGAVFRADLNNALAAIVSNNSSSSEPTTTKYAYMWWADTNEGVLKIRNSSNDGWVTLLQLDGTLTLEDGTNSAPALGFRDDLNTGIFSSAADTLDITCGGTTRGSFSSSGLSVTGNVTATTFVGNIDAVDGDFDGTLEADAITVAGVALATVIAGTTVTTATNANHVSVADNESTNENNLIPFIEDASATGNVGLESDGDFTYNPSTGTVSATVFSGSGASLTGVLKNLVEDTSPQLGGNLDTNGNNIRVGDGGRDGNQEHLRVGDDGDLRIYHTAGGDSTIEHNSLGTDLKIITTATGDDIILESEDDIVLRDNGGSTNFAKFINGGACELYHNGTKMIETTAQGISLSKGAAATITALSLSGSTLTVNAALSSHFSFTLTSNITINFSNSSVTIGQSGSIFLSQDSNGSRTASFSSAFKFVGGTAPTLSTAADAVDRIDYVVLADSKVHAVISLDVK